MIYLRRTADQWPIYSPFTGRLLKFDSAQEAADHITRAGLGGKAFYIDTERESHAHEEMAEQGQETVAGAVPVHRQAVLPKPQRRRG
jgi:hypothetical protein